jgi:ABC-2 type transport system permease protein
MIDLYLFRNAIRDLTRPKKMLAALLLVIAPALIVVLLKLHSGHRHLDKLADYGMMSEKVVFGFVMVILAVVFCTSVVAQEVEDKTIVYLLTRPVPRFRILTVKFLPAILVTLVTVWLALILTGIAAFGPTHLAGTPLARDLAIAPIGVMAYGAVFLLLATVVNRPLIYGLLYTFGWETWVPNLPGNFQKLSLMAYLRVLAPHGDTTADEVDITQVLTNVSQDSITSHLAWIVLISVIVIAFALALVAFSTREYVPRDAE